jgi:hypothetical protein
MFKYFLEVAQDLPLLGVKCRLKSSIRTDAGCIMHGSPAYSVPSRGGGPETMPIGRARNRAGASHTWIDGSVW